MQIRMASSDELGELKNIWSYCFEDSKSYVDFYFDKKCNPNRTVVLEKNESIISSIHLNQHKIKLNDKIFDTSYVVGVSTLPEARGLGKMGQLMQYSLNTMRDLGQSVSLLMPIDYRLYTKFGYVNTYNIKKVELDIFNLRNFKLTDEFVKADKSMVQDIKKVYDTYCEELNGYALRSENYYEDFIEEMKVELGHIYVAYRDDMPVAYIAYSIDSGVFTVREVYYIDKRAYESVLKFIFNHNTQTKKVVLFLSETDPIIDMLENPKDIVCELRGFMMTRIIDFVSLIDRLGIRSRSNKKINLRVEDDQLENNRGVFEIYTQNSSVVVRKLDDGSNYDLSLSIGELTSLMFSYKSIGEVAFLSGEDVEALGSLKEILSLSTKNNHINEYV